MKFHERLAVEVRKHKLTLTGLSKKTGIDATNLCHLLHGRRDNPSFRTLCKLSRALPRANIRRLLLGDDK